MAKNKKALKSIFEDIKQMEKSPIESLTLMQYEELFPKYVKIALTLALLSFFRPSLFFGK